MFEWLGIARSVWRASELAITGDRSKRLLDICRHFGADGYLSGDSAKDYLDLDLFASHGVRVEWQSYQHPTYRQLHGEYVPYLSALDLVMNMGPDSLGVLEGIA
jgi:hypothetical protein